MVVIYVVDIDPSLSLFDQYVKSLYNKIRVFESVFGFPKTAITKRGFEMNTSHTKNVQVRSFWNQEYVGLYGSVSTARGVFYKKYADFVLLPSCVQSSYFKNLRESSLQALLQYVDTLSQARRAAYVKFCFFSALELTKELQHVTLILKDNYGYSGLTSQQMNLVKNILEKVWFLKPLWVQQDINHLRERIKLLQKK